MEIINLILGMVLVVSMGANMPGAKKGLRTSVAKAASRPATYLQSVPTGASALVFLLVILGLFGIGSLDEKIVNRFLYLRIGGLIMFSFFAWLQVFSFKSLKESYAPEIVIMKNQVLVTTGIYKYIRHPQYLSQILSDLGAAIALMNFLVFPAVLLLELPLFYLRGKKEEEMMLRHYGDEYAEYKKRSGFFIPFIG